MGWVEHPSAFATLRALIASNPPMRSTAAAASMMASLDIRFAAGITLTSIITICYQ